MTHINFKIFHPGPDGTFQLEMPIHEAPESYMPVKEGKPTVRMPKKDLEEALSIPLDKSKVRAKKS